MRRLVLGFVLIAGCTTEGTVQPATSSSVPLHSTIPTISPTVTPTRAPNNTIRATHVGVPGEPTGGWGLAADFADGTLLLELAPNEVRGRMNATLARLDPRTTQMTPVLTGPPGKNMGYFSAGTRTFSWIELNPSDPAALDWRLHITDAVTGADRVVATDPGVRIISQGPWTYSYRPITYFDDRSLIYTVMVVSDGVPATQLRRLTGTSTETLFTVPDAATNAVARLTADARSIAWLQFELPKSDFDVKTTLVVRDNATGLVRRLSISSGLTLRFASDYIFVGAKEGLFVIDRGLEGAVRRISDVPNIENVALVGSQVLFRSNSDHTIRAISPEGGLAAVVDTNVTVGPYQSNPGANAVWFRYVDGDATIGIADPE